jgi:large subunit ribosomal protein L18
MAIKSKKVKKSSRQKTKFKIRKTLMGSNERPRISVFRSSKHTYAQIISDIDGKTLVSASTLEKEVLDQIASLAAKAEGKKAQSAKSVIAASAVGVVLANRCKDKNIVKVVFDRNGFVYKGRVQAVADGARSGGLEF